MEVFARACLVKVFLRMLENTCEFTETTLGTGAGIPRRMNVGWFRD
jgi:hypothetical protein